MAHAHFRERPGFAVLATDIFASFFRMIADRRKERQRQRTLRTLLEFDDVRLEDLGLCRLHLQEALAACNRRIRLGSAGRARAGR